jgi:hypothetical protein
LITLGALAQWAPDYINRQSQRDSYSYDVSFASFISGAILCVTGTVGTMLGHFLSIVRGQAPFLLFSFVAALQQTDEAS